MPLFVVVAAVDSRWLVEALERELPALKPAPGGGRFETTPHSYLEKIFQIPYSLRAMETDGYKALVRGLGGAPAQAGSAPAVLTDAVEATSMKTETSALDSQQPKTPETQESVASARLSGTDSQPNAAGNGTSTAGSHGPPDDKAVTKPRDVAERPEDDGVSAEEAAAAAKGFDLNPGALVIQPWEIKLAEEFHAFVATPRAAKRFANIYRLLKAGIDAPNLSQFEGKDGVPGDCLHAMSLLALLTGYPDVARAVFPKLAATGTGHWGKAAFTQSGAADESAAWNALDRSWRRTPASPPWSTSNNGCRVWRDTHWYGAFDGCAPRDAGRNARGS